MTCGECELLKDIDKSGELFDTRCSEKKKKGETCGT